ncbi:odorant receptor 131 [Apis mellifera]|uniref:Odorant receptor n=1 Tax=Apis mellifera TaxID=7460 RepID=A0A7M6UGP5_APIME|nr:odorant receptor 131 [Apis mellifera]|eukprot:NP_001229919.1 odorant receptor 131 [Apis mellifera]
MDVFDKYYHTYRIVLKIIGLWPYNNSVYVWIQRLCISALFLGNIIFQILSLIRSEITLRNCILILSTTCPLIIILLRYISFIIFFPMVKLLFHHICVEENAVQDLIEIQIRMKYIGNSRHMIEILLRVTFLTITLFSIFLLYFVTMDFIMPLNEFHRHILLYVTLFSVNRTIYFYILYLNFLFVITFGLLSLICTESIVGLYSYHTGMLFKIISYRIRKIITYLTMFNVSSKQIDSKLAELHRVVDIHNQAIGLVVNAITIKKDQLEILITLIIFANHLMIMFLCNYNGQILINSNEEFFHELYIPVWYFVPLKVQKILLLIMIRSSMACIFHIFGVFIPCYVGFTTMLSTSFSYFTLIYSIQ